MKRTCNLETFLVKNHDILTADLMSRKQIRQMIEKQTLVKLVAFNEPIFSSGKVETEFFQYLIIMLEDYNSVQFTDEELELGSFDTIDAIYEALRKAHDRI